MYTVYRTPQICIILLNGATYQFSTICVLTFRIVLRWGFELFVHYLSVYTAFYIQAKRAYTSHNTLHCSASHVSGVWRGTPSLVPACGERKSSILLYFSNKLFIFTCVRRTVCLLLFMFDTSTEFTFKEPFSESFSDKFICGDVLK